MDSNEIIDKFFAFISKDKKSLFYQDFEILGQFISRCNFEENHLNEIYKTMNGFVLHCLKFSIKKKKTDLSTKQTFKETKGDSKLNTITNFNTYKMMSKRQTEFNLVKSLEFQKLAVNIGKLRQIEMKISFELFRKYFMKASPKDIDNLYSVILKAQEILLHYNESKKSFSLQKKQSKRSVKKQSMRFEHERPSNSRDNSENKTIDKKSNDQSGDFKVTSVSDNEIILKNKEKFLNVLKDITEQMNKRISGGASKKGNHMINPSEEMKDNIHCYSNIDHVKINTEEKTFENVVDNQEKDKQIFEVHNRNEKKEEPSKPIGVEEVKIKVDSEKDNVTKAQSFDTDRTNNQKKTKKGCACDCLIF